MELICFLADLLRDPELQDLFTRDPERVMTDAGLSPQHQSIVLSRDHAALADQVKQEVLAMQYSPPAVPWPDAGHAAIESVEPASAGRGDTLTLTTIVARQAASLLANLGTPAPKAFGFALKGKGGELVGTRVEAETKQGTLHLTSTVVVLPSTPAGAYDVVVSLTLGGTTQFVTKPDAFTIS